MSVRFRQSSPNMGIGAYAPSRLVWVRAGDRSLARPPRRHSPTSESDATPSRAGGLAEEEDSHERSEENPHVAERKQSRRRREASPAALPKIRPQVAGVDLGSVEHWVCCPTVDGEEPNVRVFGTTTPQLEALANWLQEQGVESVAMESTHVYWIPLYELLESRGVEAVLVNARQLHHVPGRKTDMRDCQWLQVLHSCGLLRGSFRPQEAITRLRALRRQQANLGRSGRVSCSGCSRRWTR